MDRRTFLRNTVAGAAGAGLVGACSPPSETTSSAPAVHTKKSVRWRLASSFPLALDTLYGGAVVMAERVKAMTDGRFQIRPHPPGELVPGLQVMDATQQGSVEVSHTCSYYFIGKNPALVFDTCVPFGLTSRQQIAWLSEGGGLELIRKLYSDFKIINFIGGNSGAQMGGWFKSEINSAADLQGLRIRIPGLGGQVMNRLGASVQVIAGGEIFTALERGAIDAAEWVGPYDDEKLGLHKAAKYYYYPGWWEPGPQIVFQVNIDAWNKLPKEYQEIFQTACNEALMVMQARYDQRNAAALARLLKQGIELRPYSTELLTAAEKATFEILEEEAAKDNSYRELYNSWKSAREAAFRWFSTSEMAYAQFSFPRRG